MAGNVGQTIFVSFQDVTELTVTGIPFTGWKITVPAPGFLPKFVPVMVIGVVAPTSSVEGVMVLMVGSAGPVSYTHLRAHETVLDLVCRLLGN